VDLQVPYKQAKSKDEAYKIACEQITPDYVAKFNVKAEIAYDESRGLIKAVGKGFTLELSFKETQADVSLELSFLLKAFKKTILETIERKLNKHV
jgi:hypothetical protein